LTSIEYFNLTSFDSDKITIQVKFAYPLYISADPLEKDKM